MSGRLGTQRILDLLHLQRDKGVVLVSIRMVLDKDCSSFLMSILSGEPERERGDSQL